MSPGLSRSSRLAAAQLARTCSGLVAPNSTVVTSALVNGKARASAAAVVPTEAASAVRPGAAGARPVVAPARYLPLSTPPSRQNDATTPAPAACSAWVISGSSTQERCTRLSGSCTAQGGATPNPAAAAPASPDGPAGQLTIAQARALPPS